MPRRGCIGGGKCLKLRPLYHDLRLLFKTEPRSLSDIPKRFSPSLVLYRAFGFIQPNIQRFRPWLRPIIRLYPHFILGYIIIRTLIYLVCLFNLLTWRNEKLACYLGDITFHLGKFGPHYNSVFLPALTMGIISMADIYLPARFDGLWIRLLERFLCKRDARAVGLQDGPIAAKHWRFLYLIAKLNGFLINTMAIRVFLVIGGCYFINWSHGCPLIICLVWWIISSSQIVLCCYAFLMGGTQIYFAVRHCNLRLTLANSRITHLTASYDHSFEYNHLQISMRLMAACEGYLAQARLIHRYSLIFSKFSVAAAMLYILYACMMYYYMVFGQGVPRFLMASLRITTINATLFLYGALYEMSRTHLLVGNCLYVPLMLLIF